MIQVKYVHPARLLNKKQVDILTSKYIPVVELSALREWLEDERELSINHGEEGYVSISSLLASLGEIQ